MVAAGMEIAWSVVTVVWTFVAILFLTSLLPSGTALSDLGRALGQTWILFQPVAALVILVATPGLLAVWALRCSRNLPVLGVAGQRWSPGWAACGWFVPLANLAVPFAVLRELWTASGGRGRSLVTAWGVAWAARIVLLPPAVFVSPTNVPTAVLSVTILVAVPIVSATLSIVLVYRLTAVQEARARLGIPAATSVQPVWDNVYRSPRTRAGWSVAAIALTALAALAMLLDTVASLALFGAPVAASTGVLIVGWFIAAAAWVLAGLVAAPVAVAVWMHRAYGNLGLLGPGPVRWSPGWAAGAWFVPVANLVVPAVITSELWSASGPTDGRPSTAMATWWAAWVGGLVLAAVSFPLHLAAADFGVQLLADTLGILSDVGFVLAGGLAIVGVLVITRRQDARAAIGPLATA